MNRISWISRLKHWTLQFIEMLGKSAVREQGFDKDIDWTQCYRDW